MRKFDTNLKKTSQEQLNSLLECYQAGRYEDVEKLSLSITREFPKNQFAWKVLGAALKQMGKLNESLVVCKKSIELGTQDAEAHNNLGVIMKELGRLKEAEVSYRQAIILKPKYAEAHYNLGITLQEIGRLDKAEVSYRQAINLKPDYVVAYYNLGGLLIKLNKLEEAKTCFKKAIEFKPNYAEAKHFFSALTERTTNSSPRKYVENLFDNYAINFEHSLLNKLEYKTPNLITELIVAKNPKIQLGSVLDLGCGTGLIGDKIMKYCSNLEGVDLSKSMLEKASAKNIYDKLQHKDIAEYLLTENLDFNYFISSDVFVYVGELSKIFQLIKSRNKSKGKFVFSTEHTDRDGFFLEKSGRYSHSKKYIEGLCEKFGFKLSHFETINLRKNKGKFIVGGLYLLDF